MWRRPPRPSRDAEGERPQFARVGPYQSPPWAKSQGPGQERSSVPAAGTSPNTAAHHPNHLAPPPTAPHPSASSYTDKSVPAHARFPKPLDNALAVRSACKARKTLRSPVPRTMKFPASPSPRSSHVRGQNGTAADPSPHSEESVARRVPRPAAPQSKTSAHGRGAIDLWEKAPASRDRREENQLMENVSLLFRR